MINIPDEVKELLKRDNTLKNIRVHFPNGERQDITAYDLEDDSFQFSESVCTRPTLQFGLCDAAILRFTTVGVENIKGMMVEAQMEVDVSSLIEGGFQEYQTSEDVPFPFYPILFGTFVVDQCPRQADMQKRSVVAYSNTINSVEVISPWELMKLNCPIKENKAYTFNPVHFALSNLSQQIDLDFSCFGAFTGAQTPETLENQDYYGNHGFYGRNGYNCVIGYDAKELDLSAVSGTSALYAYKTGNPITTQAQVLKWVNEILVEYPVEGMTDSIRKQVKIGSSPHCRYEEYSKANKIWITTATGAMRNSGMVSSEFSGHGAQQYKLAIPYRITVTFRDSKRNVLAQRTFDLFNPDNFAVEKVPAMADGRDIVIPSISDSISRGKNSNGEYVVMDTGSLPDSMEVLEAWLELNGSFLGYDRSDEIYQIYNLAGMSEFIYPSEDLYPGEDVYPFGEYMDKSGCIEAWYDDEYVEPYTEIMAKYTNTSGELAEVSAYEHVYQDVKTVLGTAEPGRQGYAQYVFDLAENDSIANGTTVKGDVGGLKILYAWVQSKEDTLLFEIPINEDGTGFTVTADNWESAGKLNIRVDPNLDRTGYTAELYTEETIEVLYEHKVWDLSENYLIKNYQFTEAEIMALLNATLENVKDVRYMPMDIVAIGTPYREAGDLLVVETDEGDIITIILQRTLKGIQALEDNDVAD